MREQRDWVELLALLALLTLAATQLSACGSPSRPSPTQSQPQAQRDGGGSNTSTDAKVAGPTQPDAGAPSTMGARGGAGGAASADAGLGRDAGASPRDAATPAADAAAATDASVGTADKFGVRELYPTTALGREWYLPDNAEVRSKEWAPESDIVTKVSNGVFHTAGENGQGQVRLDVTSPASTAWWRNVEMTGYFRYTAAINGSSGLPQQLVLFARGERHSETNISGTQINAGVAAPAGTATWPGYPYGSATINVHCLGTAYHGNFYLSGEGFFQKEISHSNGYASRRGDVKAPSFADALGRFIGLKYVARNADANRRVHIELWLDADADGTWQKLSETDDSGGWASTDAAIDGCTSAPFSYAPDQLLSWAAPWVTFRSDSLAMDFKQLSVREIDPLP
jgi:hypothetical protein